MKDFVGNLMKLKGNEQKFIDEFTSGIYSQELLFDDLEIVERIKHHPMARWKSKQFKE